MAKSDALTKKRKEEAEKFVKQQTRAAGKAYSFIRKSSPAGTVLLSEIAALDHKLDENSSEAAKNVQAFIQTHKGAIAKLSQEEQAAIKTGIASVFYKHKLDSYVEQTKKNIEELRKAPLATRRKLLQESRENARKTLAEKLKHIPHIPPDAVREYSRQLYLVIDEFLERELAQVQKELREQKKLARAERRGLEKSNLPPAFVEKAARTEFINGAHQARQAQIAEIQSKINAHVAEILNSPAMRRNLIIARDKSSKRLMTPLEFAATPEAWDRLKHTGNLDLLNRIARIQGLVKKQEELAHSG